MGEGLIVGTTLDFFLILATISFSHPTHAATRVGQQWKGNEWNQLFKRKIIQNENMFVQ